MDSPGVEGATEYVVRPKWMPELDGLSRGAIDDVAGKDTEENRPPRAGDYSFNNLGIPGTSIQSCLPEEVREDRGYHHVGGSGGHADAWHLSTDTIDKADPDVLVRDVRVYATAVARLLDDDVLPLDVRHTIERHERTLDEYAARVGDHFDLGPVDEELTELGRAVERFYDAVDAGEVDPGTANRTIVALSRRLTRIGFDSRGPFEQDPAVYRPPYTRLAPATDLPEMDPESDEYRFLKVHLKRARNHVCHQLRTARDAIPLDG